MRRGGAWIEPRQSHARTHVQNSSAASTTGASLVLSTQRRKQMWKEWCLPWERAHPFLTGSSARPHLWPLVLPFLEGPWSLSDSWARRLPTMLGRPFIFVWSYALFWGLVYCCFSKQRGLQRLEYAPLSPVCVCGPSLEPGRICAVDHKCDFEGPRKALPYPYIPICGIFLL